MFSTSRRHFLQCDWCFHERALRFVTIFLEQPNDGYPDKYAKDEYNAE